MIRMTVQAAIDYIVSAETYDDFAVRGDDYVPVRKFRPSRYHGDDGSYKLDGVSAIKIMSCGESYILDAIRVARQYGSNVYLLQGCAINANEVSNDPGECLMATHKIIGIII